MISGLLLGPFLNAQNIIILEDDFDTTDGLGTGNNASKTTTIEDPTDSGRGNVGSVNIGDPSGTSPWGELRAPWPGSVDLPPESIPGTDTFIMKVDLYIPSDTTFNTVDAPDRFNMIIRWNGINQQNNNQKWEWDSLEADTWHTLSLTGTIRETDAEGNPTISVIPILSFYDMTNDAEPGVAAYVDNFVLEVSVPPEPDDPVIRPDHPEIPPDDPEIPPDDPDDEEPPPKLVKIKLADGKERTIQHMVATSFWSPDGTPISAAQFIERMFGDLPEFFKDEDELRGIWAQPYTRKALLESLSERGYGLQELSEIRYMIDAQDSDIYDVLAYIAFALSPITRAERVENAEDHISSRYEDRLQAFIDFVLSQYVREGVGELDVEKLPDLLTLKYQTVHDAVQELGDVTTIRQAFVGFQRYLYQESA